MADNNNNYYNNNDAAGGGPRLPPVGVHLSLREAKAAIEVGKMGQTFFVGFVRDLPVLDRVNAEYLVRSLQHFTHDGPVTELSICCHQYTREAVNILHPFFRSTTLKAIKIIGHIIGRLENELGGELLSGFHGNASVTTLDLFYIGLSDAAAGTVLSQLMERMPKLTTLICQKLPLGLEGARALQAGIRVCTLETLELGMCELGDEGARLVVEALEDNNNNTITHVDFGGNGISGSNGLPHLTPLLQQESIHSITLRGNARLFDGEEETRRFFGALAQSTTTSLNLNYCRLPTHACAALFGALSTETCAVESLDFFDHDTQLQGEGLTSLVNNLPMMLHLERLNGDVDVTNPSFLQALGKNTTMCHLYQRWREITNGSAVDIMVRNQRFRLVTKLVPYEAEQTRVAQETEDAAVIAAAADLFKKIWNRTIMKRLANDNRGATAIFFALREKMAAWIDDHADPPPSSGAGGRASPSGRARNLRSTTEQQQQQDESILTRLAAAHKASASVANTSSIGDQGHSGGEEEDGGAAGADNNNNNNSSSSSSSNQNEHIEDVDCSDDGEDEDVLSHDDDDDDDVCGDHVEANASCCNIL